MSPSYELRNAVVLALKANAAVFGLVGARIYDDVPERPEFPYISFGASWESEAGADCIEAVEIGFRIDIWSRPPGGTGEAWRIASAVRRALRDADIELTENALALFDFRRQDTLRDPDGVTTHTAIEFSAVVEIA